MRRALLILSAVAVATLATADHTAKENPGMNLLKITRLEPCRVVSFHVRDSLTPENEVFAQFKKWADSEGLLEKHRFIPVLGFNNPWGPEGKKRGYEIYCFVDRFKDVDLSSVTVKDFPGGLFAVTTIPGIDVIPEYAQQLRKAVEAHPRYALNYPTTYRHGVDPSPEYEMVYTPNAGEAKNFVLDYFIPIVEVPAEGSTARPEKAGN